MPKQVVVFDFDGTLVDSMGDFTNIAARVLQQYFGVTQSQGAALYKATSGLPFCDQVGVLFPGHANTETAISAFESEKATRYLTKPAYEDAHDMLIALKNMGYQTVISSNNFQALVDQLTQHLKLPVDMALGLRDNFAKGDAHFDHICKTFGVSRDSLVFVGDSLKDAEHAQQCEIDFIARLGTFSRDDFESRFPEVPMIQKLSELPKLLTELYPPS
ncbi:MAG: hypothetical protein COV45_08355 [Deltaproteobacteria bacterium CG11_big_fil_rev_8_21_14_0_20_47_16]|nr:MAG: hypothetical protein COV45_08355 [Deltaproteobacteria bacterium CG11_big_fil_rev_8_21_14_0_20_47_16]